VGATDSGTRCLSQERLSRTWDLGQLPAGIAARSGMGFCAGWPGERPTTVRQFDEGELPDHRPGGGHRWCM